MIYGYNRRVGAFMPRSGRYAALVPVLSAAKGDMILRPAVYE